MPSTAQAYRYRLLILRLSSRRDVAASASHLFLADACARALPDAELYRPCAAGRTLPGPR